VREEFLPWLEAHHPDLVSRYLQMYRQPYGPRQLREALGRQVSSIVAASGGIRNHVEPPRRFFRRTNPDHREDRAEQLRML
jgi:hypothetical protein